MRSYDRVKYLQKIISVLVIFSVVLIGTLYYHQTKLARHLKSREITKQTENDYYMKLPYGDSLTVRELKQDNIMMDSTLTALIQENRSLANALDSCINSTSTSTY